MNLWKTLCLMLAAGCAASVATGGLGTADAQPQPRMQTALVALNQAQLSLQAASSDKGGHRRNAIELTSRAIKQVEAGIEWDRTHPNENRPNPAP